MLVTMLGQSGSGKTTYMAALEEVLGVGRVNNFSISPKSKNIFEDSAASAKLRSAGFAGLGYQFPATGTSETTIWEFDLKHGDTHQCEFQWIDYRGGVIADIFDVDAQNDQFARNEVIEFLDYASKSHALMLFVDSVSLALHDDRKSRSLFSGAELLNQLVKILAQSCSNRNFIFVIVLTKSDSDLIPEHLRQTDFNGLKHLAREALAVFISICKEHKWSCGIVAVGSVGEGNVKSEVKESANFTEDHKVSARITKFPQPSRVEQPLFYCLAKAIEANRNVHAKHLGDISRKHYEVSARAGILNDIASFVKSTESHSTNAKRLEQMLSRGSAELKTLEYNLSRINAAANRVYPI